MSLAFPLAILVILLVAFIPIGKRANAQRDLPKRRPLVELALDPNSHDRLRHALKWDFAFIPVYTLTISLLCFIVAGWAEVPFRLTRIIILLVVFGALVDVCENLTLLHVINTSQRDFWATLARVLEILKLVFPGIGILYALAVGIRGLLHVKLWS